MNESIREQAVRIVDARHGYTFEYSSDPDAHLDEYNEEEQRLLDERGIRYDCA